MLKDLTIEKIVTKEWMLDFEHGNNRLLIGLNDDDGTHKFYAIKNANSKLKIIDLSGNA